MTDSPYEPADLESDWNSPEESSFLAVLLWGLTTGITLVAVLVSVLRPDIESFLADNVPGRYMPDAFGHLNKRIPMTMILVAISSALASWNVMRRQYKMFVPLLAVLECVCLGGG